MKLKGWRVTARGKLLDVMPIKDVSVHSPGSGCWCKPEVRKAENSHLIYVHEANDGRRVIEQFYEQLTVPEDTSNG